MQFFKHVFIRFTKYSQLPLCVIFFVCQKKSWCSGQYLLNLWFCIKLYTKRSAYKHIIHIHIHVIEYGYCVNLINTCLKICNILGSTGGYIIFFLIQNISHQIRYYQHQYEAKGWHLTTCQSYWVNHTGGYIITFSGYASNLVFS